MFIMKLKKVLFTVKSIRNFSVTSSKCGVAGSSHANAPITWNQAVDDAIHCTKYKSALSKLSLMTTNDHVNWSQNLEKIKQIDHPLRDSVR